MEERAKQLVGIINKIVQCELKVDSVVTLSSDEASLLMEHINELAADSEALAFTLSQK